MATFLANETKACQIKSYILAFFIIWAYFIESTKAQTAD